LVLTCATCGEEALELLTASPFDLGLFDIYLGPGRMNGLRVLRRSLANGHCGATAMFTGHVSVDLLHEALVAGANDYLAKGDGYDFVGEVRRLALFGREPPERRPRYTTIADLAFLRSIGATADQIHAMVEILGQGFPKDEVLLEAVGATQQALWQRLRRIRKKLGVINAKQMARLLTVLEGFVRRNRLLAHDTDADLEPLLAGAMRYYWPSGRGERKETRNEEAG
jgi:CheY-like chemotaxis protein